VVFRIEILTARVRNYSEIRGVIHFVEGGFVVDCAGGTSVFSTNGNVSHFL
jgi:hypothetical protein